MEAATVIAIVEAAADLYVKLAPLAQSVIADMSETDVAKLQAAMQKLRDANDALVTTG